MFFVCGQSCAAQGLLLVLRSAYAVVLPGPALQGCY